MGVSVEWNLKRSKGATCEEMSPSEVDLRAKARSFDAGSVSYHRVVKLHFLNNGVRVEFGLDRWSALCFLYLSESCHPAVYVTEM